MVRSEEVSTSLEIFSMSADAHGWAPPMTRMREARPETMRHAEATLGRRFENTSADEKANSLNSSRGKIQEFAIFSYHSAHRSR